MVIHVDDPVKFLNERRFTVLWSGGKDSTASLLWVLDHIKHEDWNILFIEVTGNTHPLNIEYVYSVAKQLGVFNKLIHAKRTDLDFFEYMKRYGIPIIGYSRWCLSKFKQYVIERYSYFVQVGGIRRSDSARRKHIGLIEYYRATDNISVNVIYDWAKDRVLRYIKEHGIEINPCYTLYGHSGNCMFCIYHNNTMILKTLRDPEWGPKIIESLEYVAKNKKLGPVTQRIYEKWMKIARNMNNTLEKYISGERSPA